MPASRFPGGDRYARFRRGFGGVQVVLTGEVSPVLSFNTRTGVVTLTESDVLTALGLSFTGNASKFVKVNAAADNFELVNLTSSDVTTALSYTPTSVTGLTGVQSVAAFKTGLSLVKADVGLGNVDNTSDLNKPISTATQTALDGKEPTIAAGTTAQYWRGDKSWQTLDKTAVGLSNVDNTSDLNKPISTATQTALDNKQPLDADLTAIAALTTTAFGRGFLDLADAAAGRTKLALGTLATQSGTFSGTSSGTNTGDQTITLTGDVTGSGTGSFAATIADDAVTYAKMQNVSATDRLLGRSTAGAGNVEEITCTAAGRALLDDADASAQRTTLGLGTAAIKNTGTSGDAVPLLNVANTWSANVTTNTGFVSQGSASDTPWTGAAAFVDWQSGSTFARFGAYNFTSAAWQRADVSGSVVSFSQIGTTASAANAFLDSGASNSLLRSTSSARYKTDIQDLDGQTADRILQLRPVRYRSLAPNDNPAWTFYGLVAEEVAEVDPRLVHYGYQDDQYDVVSVGQGPPQRQVRKGEVKRPDAVQYDRLAVLLLQVCKRQQAEIANLNERLDRLERTI